MLDCPAVTASESSQIHADVVVRACSALLRGIKAVTLPPRSPNLNAHCERWIRSVKTELLSKMILIVERSLRHCLENYVNHFHAERNHQGKDNVILFPAPEDRIGEMSGAIQTRERLGGLLKFYYRQAA